jgi:hypothetical protein
LEVKGRGGEVDALMEQAAQRLQRRGASAAEQEASGIALRVFTLKAQAGGESQVVYFVKGDTLGITTSVELAKQLLARWTGREEGSLSADPAYRHVMEQCAPKAPGPAPHLRWFFHPMGLARMLHESDGDARPEESPEATARRHGLDGIGGVGGCAYLATGPVDLLQRIAVYAPPPRRGSLQALALVAGGRLKPEAWAPADVSTYLTARLDLLSGFRHSGRLFDDLFADGIEGTFDGLLEDLRADDGPGVDVEKDLVRHLGTRVTAITAPAAQQRDKPTGRIIAIETKSADNVAAAVDRLFRDDPGAARTALPSGKHPLWKVGGGDDTREGTGRATTSSGVVVHRGWLLIATDFDYLRRLVTQEDGAPRLADAAVFKRVASELDRLGTDSASLMAFSDLGSDLRRSYGLLRLGKAKEADSVYARLIVALLSAGSEADEDIDYAKLPDFEQVRHHLGAVGTTGRANAQGWTLQSVLLPPPP